MSRRGVVTVAGVVVAVLAAVIVVVVRPWGDDEVVLDEEHPATVAIAGFAEAWQEGALDRIEFVPGEENAAAATALLTAGLGSPEPGPTVEVRTIDRVEGEAQRVRGHLHLTWDLGDDRVWSYDTAVTAVEIEDRWLLEWAPSVVEPSLRAGEALRARSVPGSRGTILDADGAALTGGESTVVVGIRKSRAPDPIATAERVAELTSVPLEPLLDALAAAGDDEFVEVARLPRSAYDPIRDELQPLPGTVFEEEFPESGVPADFARSVLGTTGPATAEHVEGSGGAVREGDVIGLGGLQASQEAVLAGAAGLVVEVVGADESRILETFEGSDGRDIRITLDRRVQAAAEMATTGREHPTSLVAVRVSTGDVLAIANGGGAYNRALLGRYPPGSAFKIVSAYAFGVHAGVTPDTMVPCPETITVGKVFRNAEGSAYGDVPFRTDFAKSCNTAFVDLSRRIDAGQLAEAGELLGFRPIDIGLPAFAASIPVDGDATEHAAQVIGQGRVEGNVLNVALLSASVASGTSVEPRLVIDPDAPPVPGRPLDPVVTEALRSMMRSVVTEGTATILAGVGGGEVMAKTGTAEFGAASPPESHGWMTGYQGDVAFAVVVEGGGFGSTSAGPVAAAFLDALAAG